MSDSYKAMILYGVKLTYDEYYDAIEKHESVWDEFGIKTNWVTPDDGTDYFLGITVEQTTEDYSTRLDLSALFPDPQVVKELWEGITECGLSWKIPKFYLATEIS